MCLKRLSPLKIKGNLIEIWIEKDLPESLKDETNQEVNSSIKGRLAQRNKV